MEKPIPDTTLWSPTTLFRDEARLRFSLSTNNSVGQEHAQPNADHLPNIPLKKMEDEELSLHIAHT